jgi:two-component system, chemotaxis family, protein-glutamate methylesterase/glutaminase
MESPACTLGTVVKDAAKMMELETCKDQPTLQRKPFQARSAACDVIAVAASAGGLNALSVILAHMPDDFPAAMLVVQHLDPNHKSMLASILSRHTGLQTCEARDGESLQPSRVYIAPPDQHMTLLAGGLIALVHSDRVKYVRPSADLLFVSVASAYPGRSIAVVLTGNGSDGSTGIVAVKKSGGRVIAQDKASSEYFGMPGAAIGTGVVDYILPLEQISAKLVELTLNEHTL